jgi:hypothetical protein
VKLNRKNIPSSVKTIIFGNYKKYFFEQELLDQLNTIYVNEYSASKFWVDNKIYLSKLNINVGIFVYGKDYDDFDDEYFGVKIDTSRKYNKYAGLNFSCFGNYLTMVLVIDKLDFDDYL